MIVVSMTNCPPKLRGDLSKWLLEINTGVYVGHVNAIVRDALWKRICENIHDGQATMVFTTNNEQHMDFYVHNTSWIPVDLDGIKLMKHPDKLRCPSKSELPEGYSDEAKRLIGKRRRRKSSSEGCVILDIETTGLSAEKYNIIEIGAIEIKNGEIIREYGDLISYNGIIPETVKQLTGINEDMLKEKGKDINEALKELFEFISGKTVLIYNAAFDLGFLEKEANQNKIDFPYINSKDLLSEARNKIDGLENYKLETVAEYLGLHCKQLHRAVEDCKYLYEVYKKLNEI